MHRQPLLNLLRSYAIHYPAEAATTGQFIAFVTAHENCFDRSLLIGHVTASAWVINQDGASVLLLHHLKLDKWMQPGGHCDGDPNTLNVAQKECFEETGIQTLPATTQIFDIDIHEIPQRKEIPAHLHFDVRYLMRPLPGSRITASETETNQVIWAPLKEIPNYSREKSILRMLMKTSEYI
jgi:8-oxo-dGTP pyrophosphatase MutT (NUDIX family)